MNHELVVDVIFGDRDLVTKTQTVTLKVPKGTDPEIAKNIQEDYR